MQKNEMALKRRVLIANEELPGLVEVSELKDEEGTIEVPQFGRIVTIKNGVKKFEPITMKYSVKRGTNTKEFLRSWFEDDDNNDVIIKNQDATGADADGWLLRDCELSSFVEPQYNAAAPEYHHVTVIVLCTTKPVYLPA